MSTPTTPQQPDGTASLESPRWLSAEEREGWLFISSIIFNLTRRLENQLQSEAGISFVEYMVLAMLSESDDLSLTMTELAITTNTLPARLSRVVARLEKDGYVRRSLSAEDRRVSICHLLPAGQKKVQEVAPGHVAEVRRQIFDHLTPQQVKQLAEIGEAVLGNTPSNVISIDALKRGEYPEG
ncbi:MAG: MarR family transcriptional regulator [Rothia sp.]|uniref:MarR family transcriptional regulator n=1 Tax=Rothia mucilaginosa TaxID=43675 RepID=A0A930LT46_9MICC|nr:MULTISPECIES: MarR family transcriptional regulator [unclassified Rothia (in: high G+C Gram-positive bacteria)]MBF1672918.1 MarR family transcriptional regulator [Rothia mucilaginosa]MBF1676832.1 MarR family transcriptional regulator [Rothia sp. (in: high G+C Gram-positive bacteria)]OFR67130.1 MarR family transcriptional regulator [Rothia sp. HMSC068F09]